MATNYGLISNMADGIREGMITYQTMQNMKNQQQQQQLLTGTQKNAETGELEYTPQKQQEMQLKSQQTQRSVDSLNPESDYSKNIRTMGRGLIHDDAGKIIPEGASAADLTGENGLLGNYMKAQSAEKLGQVRLDSTDKRLGLQREKFDYSQDKEARATGNNDSFLKVLIPRLEGAAKIKELIGAANSGKVVSNQALLGQVNSELARLETGSQAPGLGQAEKTELEDKKAKFQAIIDSFKGGEPEAAVDPEILNTVAKQVDELANSYKTAIDSRNRFLKAGMSERQKGIIDSKSSQIQEDYGPRLNGWEGASGGKGLIQDPASGGPKVGDVEDGHQFLGGNPADPKSWKAVSK